jgi:hypothetical protein
VHALETAKAVAQLAEPGNRAQTVTQRAADRAVPEDEGSEKQGEEHEHRAERQQRRAPAVAEVEAILVEIATLLPQADHRHGIEDEGNDVGDVAPERREDAPDLKHCRRQRSGEGEEHEHLADHAAGRLGCDLPSRLLVRSLRHPHGPPEGHGRSSSPLLASRQAGESGYIGPSRDSKL